MTSTAKKFVSHFDVEKIRRDFPLLQKNFHGKPIVYLDNGASALKPQAVIDRIAKFYSEEYSNVHRGIYSLSQRATDFYEEAREKVRAFLNAREAREIIFVRGTTEAINLVAQTHGRSRIGRGDEILISRMEHHSNIVPWQILCEQTGAALKIIPMNTDGELLPEKYETLLTPQTKLVSIAHISNALGTVNPVKKMIELAHAKNIPVLVDGAQAVPHRRVDVQDLDCDFYAFSGHKLFGPTGIGVLYGKAKLLEAMPPYQGGGDMIASVSFEKTKYNAIPYKFEAGTPHIAGVIGLGAALDYLNEIDWEAFHEHESELLDYGTAKLLKISGLKMIGTAKDKAGILSFTLDGIHPHDIGTILDGEGIAVRAGHHCAQPVMDFFKIPATARASLAFYNTREDLDRLAEGVRKVIKIFGN